VSCVTLRLLLMPLAGCLLLSAPAALRACLQLSAGASATPHRLRRCTKTAGSTLEHYFSVCTTGRAHDRCLNYLHVENATQVQHLLDVWDEYFVFTYGRNVLRRAISQYQYLTHFMTGAACPPVSWGAFCRDPYLLGDICATHRSCCNQSALHQYLHVIPQANCLLTADQRWAMDWVGRVEHFEEDFQSLLGILNARGGGVPKLPAVEPQKMNYNQSPCQALASRRRLSWDVINGTLNFCDKVGGWVDWGAGAGAWQGFCTATAC
jgi:hypothetical protein